jgi:hypothetical protein
MNKVIYCFWFGPQMSDNRKRCFDSIVQNSGVLVILVTESNLHNFILSEYPLHTGFNYLSATHKSDYLRSYFMHFYGGGYTDIKECNFNWNKYYNTLDISDKYFIGYQELAPIDIAYYPVSGFYKELIGNGSFIFKNQNHFTKLWYDETQKKMDIIYPVLTNNPGTYHCRAVTGGVFQEEGFNDSKYPLEWNELMGRIFHKLQYENRDSFLNTFPYPNTKNYR